MTERRGYKWIAKEIERLDPEVDFEEIWRLSTCFWVNDFMMSYLYTTGFPHFILAPTGPRSLDLTNKIFARTEKREEDTMDHIWAWFERGPSSPEVQKSVAIVNKIHQGLWKRDPGLFSHIDEFTYTMCVLGADIHRLRLRIGMPGYTTNQQIACHRFWREISTMFVSEVGPVTQEFPEDFAGMLAYLDEFESRDWPKTDTGHRAIMMLADEFGKNWFPKGFQWVGRKLIFSMLDEPTHRVHRLPYPNRALVMVNKMIMLSVFFAKEKVLPDPKLSTPDRSRRAAERKGQVLRRDRKFAVSGSKAA